MNMNNVKTWRTENLPAAAYIHGGRHLKFVRCEPTRPGLSSFVFEDPEDKGSDLEYAYDSGATGVLSAFFSAIKFLRTQMTAVAKSSQNLGASFNGHSSAASR
jgi:hypothetical protein